MLAIIKTSDIKDFFSEENIKAVHNLNQDISSSVSLEESHDPIKRKRKKKQK